MPVRLHHAVLSCVVTRGTLRTHLNERATQEMHCWLTVHLELMRGGSFDSSPPAQATLPEPALVIGLKMQLLDGGHGPWGPASTKECSAFSGPHQSSDRLGHCHDVFGLAQKSISAGQVCRSFINGGR